MRGDGVGVGDVGEVSGMVRERGDTAGGDDSRGAGRERERGVVGGRWRGEYGSTREQGGDGVGVSDGARGEHGAGCFHRIGPRGGDGVRGDGVGVGDVGEVCSRSQVAGITRPGADRVREACQHHAHMVSG